MERLKYLWYLSRVSKTLGDDKIQRHENFMVTKDMKRFIKSHEETQPTGIKLVTSFMGERYRLHI